MEQVSKFTEQVRGAAGDDIVDAHALAIEAWGERCEDNNSGLLAFAYLWRRFGPPWRGGDDHKSLVDYTLTTSEPDVFLWIHLSGSRLSLCAGYLAYESVGEEHRKPIVDWEVAFRQWWWDRHPEFESWEETEENQKKVAEMYWGDRMETRNIEAAEEQIGPFPIPSDPREWRTAGGTVRRVNQALFDAMQELLTPVYVRDVPINLFGRCEDTDTAAPRSKYAGYGVPQAAMDELLND